MAANDRVAGFWVLVYVRLPVQVAWPGGPV